MSQKSQGRLNRKRMIEHKILDRKLLEKVENILEYYCHEEFSAIKREWELIGGDEMLQRAYDLISFGYPELSSKDPKSKKTIVLLTMCGLASELMDDHYGSFEFFTLLGVALRYAEDNIDFNPSRDIKIIGNACLALHHDIDIHKGMSESAAFGKYQNPEYLAEFIFEHHSRGQFKTPSPADFINSAVDFACSKTNPFRFDFNSIDGMYFYCVILIQYIDYQNETFLEDMDIPEEELGFKVCKILDDINWAEELGLLNPTSDPRFLSSFHQFIISDIPKNFSDDRSEWLFDKFWKRFLEQSGLMTELNNHQLSSKNTDI